MPSYNQGQFIREAIDSVLSQEGCSAELIVMDGGSDDGTVEILKSYGDKITYTSGPDDGQSWAINEGMRRTSGDIVCWLNSDDRFLPGALKTVTEVFGADPDLEFVTGHGYNIAEDGTFVGDVGARPALQWELIHHRNSFNQPSCFMSRALWFDLDGLDESLDYVMDWDLWIRCGCAKSRFITQPLSENRNYADNKTNSGGQDRLDEIKKMVETYAGFDNPPVLALYEIETKLNGADVSGEERKRLGPELNSGMSQRLTGIDEQGAFGRSFHVSASARHAGDPIRFRFSPVSRYVDSFREQRPCVLRWSSKAAGSGEFLLENNGESQVFEVPVEAKEGEVITMTVECVGQGFTPVSGAEILGYIDGVL